MVQLDPNTTNGLSQTSAADASQGRAVALERFQVRLGQLAPDDVDTLTTAVVLCVGYTPPAAP